MLFGPNDEYDLLSDNNSIFKSEEYVFNGSFFFHSRYDNYMDYYNIEQAQYKQERFNIEDIFPNNFEKEEDTKKEDEKEKIYYTVYEEKSNVLTATTEKKHIQKKYFRIDKTKKRNKDYKKKGRKRKNSISEPTKNDKNRDDNIRIRILTLFMNRIQIYINSKLSKYFRTKSKKNLIKKIERINKLSSKVDECKNFLQKNIGEVFSAPLSNRCTNYSKDFNKNLIDNLKKNSQNEEIKGLFDKTVKEMYEIYISNTIHEFNLNKDLEKIKQEDENYAVEFKKKALNLITSINEKVGRKKRKIKWGDDYSL